MADLPERDELVLVTVKKLMPYGAFCELDEYGKHEAFIHISEVAPRWIKNIHEFLHEGQKLVAKVHHIEIEKNQIDLSLKRVTESEKKLKIEGSRKERRAEKLFEVALKLAKSTKTESVAAKAALEEKHGNLMEAMEQLSENGEGALSGLRIEKGLGKALVDVAAKNIKKARAEVNGILNIVSYAPNGVEIIKKLFASVQKNDQADVKVLYLGAPRYQIQVIADDFKKADSALERVAGKIIESAKEFHAFAEFSRMEN